MTGGIYIPENKQDEFFERSLSSLVQAAEKIDSISLQIYIAKIREDKEKLAEIVNNAISLYEIATIVEALSLIGEFELARKATKAIASREKAAEAMMAIAEKSGDLEDLRNLERYIKYEMTDDFEQNSFMEKLICLLAKERNYIWAEVLAKNSDHVTFNFGKIAKGALENGDLDMAIEYALIGEDADILFEILKGILAEDFQKARDLAERMQDLWWGSFYRSEAYFGIYLSSGKSEDIEKAASIIMDAIKNKESSDSLDSYCDLAIKIAIKCKNSEMIEELSGLLDPSNWRDQEIIKKSVERLLLAKERRKKQR